MVKEIVRDEVNLCRSREKPVSFNRRKPEESEITKLDSLDHLHDFIRMLDAEGYPRAFLSHDGYRFEFSRSALYDGRIVADVHITGPLNRRTSPISSAITALKIFPTHGKL